MKSYLTGITAGLLMVAAPHAAVAQYPGQTEDLLKVDIRIPLEALAFDYTDVRLLDGPFKHAMETDQRWLKQADVNCFLHSFRVNAGIATNAPALGGWESLDCEVRGHTLGHFLSALALMYASTQDEQYRTKGEELVKGLAECQQALNRDGYLSAFPEYFIDRAIKGEQVWAPWYTLHKMYAGMLDQYTLCGNEQAREVLEGMCEWAYRKLKPLTYEELQRMLLAEFGGMPEVLYNIYAVTGDPRCKELAGMFYHEQILSPLAERRDSLAGIHANTQIPKIIGEARNYELTGCPRSETIAEFFWDAVLHDHTYVTGGNSDCEVFNPAGKFSDYLSEHTTETCNTYNMLKLTRHLFTWKALPIYADYYERALYNHILSSQSPVSGGVTYYHTLHPGSAKYFQHPFCENTCCIGTSFENHAKYGESIYYRTPDNKGLYVNLFIASELNWEEKELTFRQETRFPDETSTTLTIAHAPTSGVRMSLLLRYPAWAVSGVTVRVNGRKQSVRETPGSYIRLDRNWKQGDEITLEMPMSLHVECMPDNPNRGAILYGPIVLAAELGKREASEGNPTIPGLRIAPDYAPEKWLRPVEGQPLTFRTVGAGSPEEITLSPLFRNYDRHYTVYFDFSGIEKPE